MKAYSKIINQIESTLTPNLLNPGVVEEITEDNLCFPRPGLTNQPSFTLVATLMPMFMLSNPRPPLLNSPLRNLQPNRIKPHPRQ